MAARQRRDSSSPSQTASGYDAYTGMFILSLLATLTSLAFVWLDYNQYPSQPPKLSSMVSAPMSKLAEPPPPPGNAK